MAKLSNVKVSLRLLNSFGENTTLLKFDPKERKWIVYCSYYPHITFFVAEAIKRRVRFRLDHRGFKAKFDPEKSWLQFLPYYGRGHWRLSNIPIEYKREVMVFVQLRRKGTITKEMFDAELQKVRAKYKIVPRTKTKS